MHANNTLQGVFIQEDKNRFKCKIFLNDMLETCYVASSTKLSKYLKLQNKPVLVVPNAGTKTKYTLIAVYSHRNWVLVNLTLVNSIIAKELHRKVFSFLGSRNNIKQEKTISGYKSDIYIDTTSTIIEIKTVIAETSVAYFPLYNSTRAIEQLKKIQRLLHCGYKVVYLIVCLHPSVKEVVIDEDSIYYKYFTVCLQSGMICKGCKIKYKRGTFVVGSTIKINIGA